MNDKFRDIHQFQANKDVKIILLNKRLNQQPPQKLWKKNPPYILITSCNQLMLQVTYCKNYLFALVEHAKNAKTNILLGLRKGKLDLSTACWQWSTIEQKLRFKKN